MILIDTLSYTSRLRQVNPGEKFAFCMLTLIFCVVSRSLAVAGVVLAATGFLTVRRGGIPLSRYLSLLRIPAVFLLLCSAAVMVNLSRTPLNAFALPIGSWYLTGSEEGILAGFRLALTALSAVSCLYFLALSTPPPDLLYLGKKSGFDRSVHVRLCPLHEAVVWHCSRVVRLAVSFSLCCAPLRSVFRPHQHGLQLPVAVAVHGLVGFLAPLWLHSDHEPASTAVDVRPHAFIQVGQVSLYL